MHSWYHYIIEMQNKKGIHLHCIENKKKLFETKLAVV
jgi:hypothetical protein